MKNILCILAFLAFPAMLFAQNFLWYNGKESPYIISSEDELIGFQQIIASNVSFDGKEILLANDIVLTSSNWMPIGSSASPFKGTFNGQGKTISGLKVSGVDYAGLFGYVGEGGQIKNLNVEATTIATARSGKTIRYAGGLAAYYASTKPIENCGVKADSIIGIGTGADNVNSDFGYGYSGGLVGYANSALTIINSYASGNVTGIGTGSGTYRVDYGYGGGLAGYVNSALTITNSYASGNVVAGYYDGYAYGGGLVGYVKAALTITNSYASGSVQSRGGNYGGGLVGYANNASTIKTSYASGTISASYKGGIFGKWKSGTNTDVYYNSDGGATKAAGEGSPTGILAKTSVNLKKRATYANWDFNEIWGIAENISYPYLKTNPRKITVPISDALEVEYLPAQTYTGSQIKPEPVVRLISNGAVLTKGDGNDYLLAYGTNKDTGTGTVTIFGIETYIGLEESISFEIIPKTITITDAAAQNKIYDGTTEAAIEGTLNGVAAGDNVSIGKGVFASKNAGEGISVSNVALAGASIANYKLTQPAGLTANIAKKDLTITLNPKTVEITASTPMSVANGYIDYNGLVSGETKSVISGTSAIYRNNSLLSATPAAGIYEITLSGTRSATNYNIYHDSEGLFLKVVSDPVNLATCAVADIPAQDYTGEQITPANIAVTCGTTLVSEADYAISYGDNKNAGAAAGRVIITANAESEFYTGSIEKTFAITPKALTVAGAQVSDKVYDGTTEATITGTPALVGVLDGDIENVSIDNLTGAFANANVGTDIDVSINASLSGAAAENYSVTQLELKGAITAKPLTQDLIQAIASQTYTGSEITPSITVMDGSNILAIDTDYDVSYSNNINAGSASVSITGKGNYVGTAESPFQISPRKLHMLMNGGIKNLTYTGEALTPPANVVDGTKTLVEGTDYEILYYINNTDIGTASVAVEGIGNYYGKEEFPFGIVAGETTPIRTPQIAASQIRAQSAANAIMLQNLPQNAKIEAYNLQGKQIYSATSHSPLATSLSIPVSAVGIYIVKVSLGSQKQILRVPVR